MGVAWEALLGSSFGFTGTRDAITAPQRDRLMEFLSVQAPLGMVKMHYGDCPTGADHEMWRLCRATGIWVISHPSNLNPGRKVFFGDEIRETKPPLDRNLDIVSESDYLVATPKEYTENFRSGTWTTMRYARNHNRTVAVVYPDGRVDIEVPGW